MDRKEQGLLGHMWLLVKDLGKSSASLSFPPGITMAITPVVGGVGSPTCILSPAMSHGTHQRFSPLSLPAYEGICGHGELQEGSVCRMLVGAGDLTRTRRPKASCVQLQSVQGPQLSLEQNLKCLSSQGKKSPAAPISPSYSPHLIWSFACPLGRALSLALLTQHPRHRQQMEAGFPEAPGQSLPGVSVPTWVPSAPREYDAGFA